MKKIFLLVITFMLLFVVSSKADYNSDLKDFISKMTDKFDTINSIKNKDKWTTEAYKYANEILDIKWMSNFILGKYRRTLTKEQINDFVKYYSIYLLNNYLKTLALFSKDNVNIVSIEQNKENVFFTNLTVKANDNNIKIKLRIVKKENILYITDIIAENVSFINSQRNEINSFLDSNGFDALIEKIK